MSQVLHRTPIEIQKAGWEALKKQLGLPGAIRFLLQYEKGEGDYTQLRRKIFKGETVKSLINEMKKERKVSVRKD
ncbi:MAG TPA: hypothetical protein VEK32_00160 [Thermodesulfobacteriota bacterium]|nr:hypothetical protein [Thermodesulfobacteriota bacterium]